MADDHNFDMSTLLSEAAVLCTSSTGSPLASLLSLAASYTTAPIGSIYATTTAEDYLVWAAGTRDIDLTALAQSALDEIPLSKTGCVTLQCGPLVLGVWVTSAPDGTVEQQEWRVIATAVAPFVTLALRDLRRQDIVNEAQAQAERRIREVSSVYEIGQAIDRVDTERLLGIITKKAALVMDAQACSLLMRDTDQNILTIAASYGLAREIVENTQIYMGEGIAGQVAQTGEPLLLNSLDDDPRFQGSPIKSNPTICSSLCMPMKNEDCSIQGVLCIRRNAGAGSTCFDDEDMRLFSIFATQASLAINNRQLYAQLTNKLQELSTLSALTETIISTRDVDHVLNLIADSIINVVHFDRCRIYLSDIDTGRFSARIVRGFGPTASARKDANIGIGEGVIGRVAKTQSPMLVNNLEHASVAANKYARSLGIQSFYAQPIVARGRCIGVIVVSNRDFARPIPQSRIELLSTFVHQAGMAIENARFYESQEHRFAELTTLYEVSRTLAATSGVQKAAETVTDFATKITDSNAGILLLFDATHDSLRALHWVGVSEALDHRLSMLLTPLPVLPAARLLRMPRLLTYPDVKELFGTEWQPLCDAFLARHLSVALVPLVVETAAVGFLLLGKQQAEYGVEELKLIAVASSQAATVLSSAWSYERRIGQRELELSAIYELMQKVRLATTLHEALNSILDIVASLVWSEEALLYTLDEGGVTMTVRAARSPRSEALIGRARLSVTGDSIAARALRERNALISSDPVTDVEDLSGGMHPEVDTVRSLVAVPLVVGEELIGVLMLKSDTPDIYTEDGVRMLHLVASQAATIYREMSSLRTLTRYTENILRSIAAGVITVDKDGYIVTWNARAEEIVNLRAHEIIGKHYREFIQLLQVDAPVRDETVRMVEMTAQTGKVFTRNQLCYHSPQGHETYVNLSASQLKSESGEYLGIVVVFEDITNEMQMKEEVERVSKLAETGQLAANIAHELRNPLSSIKGAAQLIRNELPEDYIAQHGEFLDIIIEEVNGLNRITSEFLEFSRVTPPEMRTISLNSLIARLLQFMRTYLHGQDVSVILACDEDLPDVYIDKSQIEQVVKNLVINATQAMPHGGTLTVQSRYLKAQNIAEVEFTDTGVGIKPNLLEKIWMPFFTTKTKGTGLGLAIVRKIVETHGGRLSVRSQHGEGSTFTMHLPVQPLHPNMMPHVRMEITEQRSDQPGGIFEISSLTSD